MTLRDKASALRDEPVVASLRKGVTFPLRGVQDIYGHSHKFTAFQNPNSPDAKKDCIAKMLVGRGHLRDDARMSKSAPVVQLSPIAVRPKGKAPAMFRKSPALVEAELSPTATRLFARCPKIQQMPR